LIDGPTGRTITYADLRTRIGTVAKGFTTRGVADGDVVNIHLPNTPEYVVAFHALAGLGAVSTTSNPLYTVTELTHQYKDSKAKFAITAPPFYETVKAAAGAAGVKDVWVLGEESGKFLLANDGTSVPRSVPMNPQTKTLVLPYSSGTTGLPKGVRTWGGVRPMRCTNTPAPTLPRCPLCVGGADPPQPGVQPGANHGPPRLQRRPADQRRVPRPPALLPHLWPHVR